MHTSGDSDDGLCPVQHEYGPRLLLSVIAMDVGSRVVNIVDPYSVLINNTHDSNYTCDMVHRVPL